MLLDGYVSGGSSFAELMGLLCSGTTAKAMGGNSFALMWKTHLRLGCCGFGLVLGLRGVGALWGKFIFDWTASLCRGSYDKWEEVYKKPDPIA